jgi:DNA-nicking Smr family endonuclease
MSRERGRSGRRLSAEERSLWKTVTQSVAPLRPQQAGELATQEASAPGRPAPAPLAEVKTQSAPVKRRAPPLAPLGRRLKQRVARGNDPIDARIDLHGLRQNEAHDALTRFVRTAQARNAKLVLVITGKGTRRSDTLGGERGVLNRLVPLWLRLPELRDAVIGFEQAHGSHGGEGALYVRIRRRRNS